jgi:hypothetical protein
MGFQAVEANIGAGAKKMPGVAARLLRTSDVN